MQYALRMVEGEQESGLPILVTANDVREVVQLLKKRPEGITVVEASDAAKRRLFDPRKIAAYELWGIVSKSGDRIRLSALGREFASRLAPEAELYRVLLDNTPPYRALLEWIHRRRLELVTDADIIGYWREHFPEAVRGGERTARGHVLSLLQLCHAAEIGAATVGRKGQPSRLRVDHAELAAHLQSPSRPAPERHDEEGERPFAQQTTRLRTAPSQRLRVFISAPEGSAVIGRIRDALQMADIVSEVIERDSDADELIPERTRQVMRRCEAGVIVVTRADYEPGRDGEPVLKQSTLLEIGAASVHYARSLVLLSDSEVRLPFNLEGFRHYELDGDELTWETGLQLVRAIKQFSSELKEATAPPEASE